MVSDGVIEVDKKLFTLKEIELPDEEFEEYMKEARYLFYDKELKIIYPEDIEKQKLKDGARKEVIESIKNATTVNEIKTQILKLIDII